MPLGSSSIPTQVLGVRWVGPTVFSPSAAPVRAACQLAAQTHGGMVCLTVASPPASGLTCLRPCHLPRCVGNFREDAAKWPGGEVAAYMERVVGEILPFLQQAYGAATDPRHLAFGGSSFGGICTLWASMHYADTFGAVLVESPSLWFADESFLR